MTLFGGGPIPDDLPRLPAPIAGGGGCLVCGASLGPCDDRAHLAELRRELRELEASLEAAALAVRRLRRSALELAARLSVAIE